MGYGKSISIKREEELTKDDEALEQNCINAPLTVRQLRKILLVVGLPSCLLSYLLRLRVRWKDMTSE